MSAKAEIYEAEMISSDPVNPYAAPAPLEDANAIAISEGIGRASEEEIIEANKSLVRCEVTFVATVCSYIAMTAVGSEIVYWIWIISIFIAWCCFVRMVLSCNELGLAVFGMIAVSPIPVLGLFMFFAGKKQANRFLIWNGYRPGFLGAKPDREEISIMNTNPSYRPSAYVTRSGSKRRFPWSLSDSFLALLILIAIAAIISSQVN